MDQLLAYDVATASDVSFVGIDRKEGVRFEDVTFRSLTGGPPVQAFIVRPDSGPGPFPGVLFVHWYEPSSPSSNRTQFLDEAAALARHGVVSLLVSTFWSDSAQYNSRRWEDDFQNSVDQAKDLRRAPDVLLAQPGVDKGRIGYVGHDYGAMFGALLAAVDLRPKAYVLIAGTSRFSNWYLFGSGSGVPTGEELERFRARLALIDPLGVIGRAKAPIFFQLGELDPYTPREDFIELYLAAPATTRIATYSSDHPMESRVIHLDRFFWLVEQLGLPISPGSSEPPQE